MKVHLQARPLGEFEMRVVDGLRRSGSTQIKMLMAIVEEGTYSVIVTRDPIHKPGKSIPDERWHLSIAGEHDVPPWSHLAAIAHEVRPGVPFVIGVPPRSWWINVHPHCLHLFETKDQNLVEQWRAERQGHKPT